MSMEFSTSIQSFNTDFNLNAIQDYNKFLKKQAAFDFDTETTDFSKILDKATKSTPLKDQLDPTGLGSFANKIGNGFSDALNAVNIPKVEVHISNIYEREDFRKVNFIKDECIASVVGKGLDGYLEAIDILINRK